MSDSPPVGLSQLDRAQIFDAIRPAHTYSDNGNNADHVRSRNAVERKETNFTLDIDPVSSSPPTSTVAGRRTLADMLNDHHSVLFAAIGAVVKERSNAAPGADTSSAPSPFPTTRFVSSGSPRIGSTNLGAFEGNLEELDHEVEMVLQNADSTQQTPLVTRPPSNVNTRARSSSSAQAPVRHLWPPTAAVPSQPPAELPTLSINSSTGQLDITPMLSARVRSTPQGSPTSDAHTLASSASAAGAVPQSPLVLSRGRTPTMGPSTPLKRLSSIGAPVPSPNPNIKAALDPLTPRTPHMKGVRTVVPTISYSTMSSPRNLKSRGSLVASPDAASEELKQRNSFSKLINGGGYQFQPVSPSPLSHQFGRQTPKNNNHQDLTSPVVFHAAPSSPLREVATGPNKDSKPSTVTPPTQFVTLQLPPKHQRLRKPGSLDMSKVSVFGTHSNPESTSASPFSLSPRGINESPRERPPRTPRAQHHSIDLSASPPVQPSLQTTTVLASLSSDSKYLGLPTSTTTSTSVAWPLTPPKSNRNSESINSNISSSQQQPPASPPTSSNPAHNLAPPPTVSAVPSSASAAETPAASKPATATATPTMGKSPLLGPSRAQQRQTPPAINTSHTPINNSSPSLRSAAALHSLLSNSSASSAVLQAAQQKLNSIAQHHTLRHSVTSGGTAGRDGGFLHDYSVIKEETNSNIQSSLNTGGSMNSNTSKTVHLTQPNSPMFLGVPGQSNHSKSGSSGGLENSKSKNAMGISPGLTSVNGRKGGAQGTTVESSPKTPIKSSGPSPRMIPSLGPTLQIPRLNNKGHSSSGGDGGGSAGRFSKSPALTPRGLHSHLNSSSLNDPPGSSFLGSSHIPSSGDGGTDVPETSVGLDELPAGGLFNRDMSGAGGRSKRFSNTGGSRRHSDDYFNYKQKALQEKQAKKFRKRMQIQQAMMTSASASTNLNLSEADEPFFFMHPGSTVFNVWKVILLISVWYTCFETSFVVSFNVITAFPSKYPAIVILNLVTDFIMLLDLWVYFRKGFYDSTLVLQTSTAAIRKKYLMTWLLPDLIAAPPLEFIQVVLIGSHGLDYAPINSLEFQLCKLPRLIKLLKVINFSDLRSRLEVNETVRAFFAFVYLLLIGHIVACGFFLIARLEPSDAYTWVAHAQISDSGKVEQYVYSLYWALSTLISIGWGGFVSPLTVAERMYTIFVVLFASLAYAQVMANFMLMIENINRSQQEHEMKMSNLQVFLDRHTFHPELRQRIFDYQTINYEYLNQHIGKHVFLRHEEETTLRRKDAEEYRRNLARHDTLRMQRSQRKLLEETWHNEERQLMEHEAEFHGIELPDFDLDPKNIAALHVLTEALYVRVNAAVPELTAGTPHPLANYFPFAAQAAVDEQTEKAARIADSNLHHMADMVSGSRAVPGSAAWLDEAIDHFDDEQVKAKTVEFFSSSSSSTQSHNMAERSEDKILATLPKCYSLEIMLHLHGKLIYNIFLFRDLNSSILSALTKELRTRIYVKDDFICKRKLMGRRMYLLKQGEVQTVEFSEVAKKIAMAQRKQREEQAAKIKEAMDLEKSEKSVSESFSLFFRKTKRQGSARDLLSNPNIVNSPAAKPTLRTYHHGFHFGESSYLRGYFDQSIRVSSSVAEVCVLEYDSFLRISEAYPEFARCVLGSVEKKEEAERMKALSELKAEAEKRNRLEARQAGYLNKTNTTAASPRAGGVSGRISSGASPTTVGGGNKSLDMKLHEIQTSTRASLTNERKKSLGGSGGGSSAGKGSLVDRQKSNPSVASPTVGNSSHQRNPSQTVLDTLAKTNAAHSPKNGTDSIATRGTWTITRDNVHESKFNSDATTVTGSAATDSISPTMASTFTMPLNSLSHGGMTRTSTLSSTTSNASLHPSALSTPEIRGAAFGNHDLHHHNFLSTIAAVPGSSSSSSNGSEFIPGLNGVSIFGPKLSMITDSSSSTPLTNMTLRSDLMVKDSALGPDMMGGEDDSASTSGDQGAQFINAHISFATSRAGSPSHSVWSSAQGGSSAMPGGSARGGSFNLPLQSNSARASIHSGESSGAVQVGELLSFDAAEFKNNASPRTRHDNINE